MIDSKIKFYAHNVSFVLGYFMLYNTKLFPQYLGGEGGKKINNNLK